MERKLNNILVIAIIGVVCFMSMGYSILNRELNITGELTYRPKADIRITNIIQKELSNAVIQYVDFSKNEISLAYTPSNTSTTVTYEIEITNFSNIEMGILKIVGLPSNTEIDGYSLGTKLTNKGESLMGGDSTTFMITFRPDTVETKTILLSFDFEEAYKITYEGFDDTSSYKKEVLKGDTFIQNFGTNFPNKVNVTMNGKTVIPTYVDGIITISNVNGNIHIKALNIPSYTDSCEVHPNPPVLNGDMIPVVYDEEKQSWIKQDLDKTYDYCNQIWANAVTIDKNPLIVDLSSNNNINGKARNGVLIGDGIVSFDGEDDYIYTGVKATFTEVTLVLRVKFDSLPTNDDFEFFGVKQNINIVYTSSNEFNFIYKNDIGSLQKVILQKEVNLNDYYTIVATYDGITMSLYVNGEKASRDASITPASSNASFTIGGWEYNGRLYGLSKMTVSDALIFDQGLTEEEILAHYSGEVTLGETAPILYYDFKNIPTRDYIKNAPVGTAIIEQTINTMWVWIPRYSYTIKKETESTNYFGKGSFGNTIPTRELPGEIDVKFITTSEDDKDGSAQYTGSIAENWRTNEAFNFDGVNRAGIWISKFEMTGNCSEICVDETCDVTGVRSMPGNKIITNKDNADFFYMARSMQVGYSDIFGFNKNSGDLHMIKSDEWGAVAYLSQSRYGKYGNTMYTGINKKIYVNSCPDYKAGRSNGDTTGVDGGEYHYNDLTNLGEGRGLAGPGASTTGTVYGIYDMNGGGNERIMALIGNDDGPIVARSNCDSGFNGQAANGKKCSNGVNLPDEKYYNLYKTKDPTSNSFNINANTACSGDVCFGHALSETYGSADGGEYGWYDDYVRLPDITSQSVWMVRGGRYNNDHAGIFSTSNVSGNTNSGHSTRFVLAP